MTAWENFCFMSILFMDSLIIMKHIFAITTHACHCEGQSPEAISEKVPQSLLWQTMIAVCVSFFAMILLLPCFAFAEVKIFEKEYTYQASEIDSKVTSRAIAVEQVKRLEIIGTDTIKSK